MFYTFLLLLQLTDEQKKWLDVLRLKGTTRQGQKDGSLNPVNRIRRYSKLPNTFNVGLLNSISFSCSSPNHITISPLAPVTLHMYCTYADREICLSAVCALTL